ncbi:MAG: hypothetical protein Q9195_004961 [Heterodermia aff. obscurata]
MSLWDEACLSFAQALREKREDPAAIRQFLQDKASLEDARQSATSLQNDSNRKYGSTEGRWKGISAKWIRSIMGNLDQFLTLGDASMKAAPDSVGLVWFAIRNILGAIQNDYKLYETFYDGLKDITDMMVLVRTYDEIYAGHAVKASGSIYEELSKNILEVYISILDYSYSVKKFITGGKRSKLVHALMDTVGALNREFDNKTAAIKAQKDKIVQNSGAAFQQKTTDKLGDVSDEVVTIQQKMRELYEFLQQSLNDSKEILSELKASKQPSHREIAFAEHEKNMKRLTPWLDGSAGTKSIHMSEREDGTCSWITETPNYKTWCDSDTSAILCVTGEASSGKSVLGTYVCEQLGSETDHDARVVAQYISVNTKPNDKSDTSRLIGNTLLRFIYEFALDDTGDDLLLQRCNSLFSHPKQRKPKDSLRGGRESGRSVRSPDAGGDNALDLLDVYPSLLKELQKRLVLVIDGVDGLSEDDQVQLAKLITDLTSEAGIHVRILLLCRPSSQIQFKLGDTDIPHILMADHNIGDIKLIAEKGLEMVPGISPAEKNEIKVAILDKTGHQIRYVTQVALSFLLTPLRRPISKWVEDLPESLNETYHQHLHQLTPSYRRLLRIALSWTLFSKFPPLVQEIMEAYSGVYLDDSTSENRTDTNIRLYCEQIQKAAGPFLEIRENRTVTLVDSQAVRSFCRPDQDKPDVDVEGTVCAKCKAQISDSFAMSEREEHLTMAITCLKHLNSASFQARHLSDYLDKARSRAGKKQTPTETQGDEQSAQAETPGINHVLDQVAANEGLDSGSEDTSASDTSAEAEVQQPERDESENEVADEDESIFSDQDKEDIEQTLDLNPDFELERGRYELIAWFYHVQNAERLWTPDERKSSPEWAKLLHEMEKFFLIDTVGFEAWKLYFVYYDAQDRDPIFWSAEYGLLSLAELLLDKGAKVMDTTSNGYNVLHIASKAPNRLDTLRFFLNHGGDPSIEVPANIPVLHLWLLFEADAKCVEELLRHGASCSLIDQKWKLNALHYFGLRGKDTKVLNLLLDNPFDTENRSNIGVRDGDGESALHKLLSRQQIPLAILEAFLDRRADVNIEDDHSERPLYEAAYWGENAAVEMIINRVNDVDDDNKWGRTALHAAAFSGQTETVEILIKHGADPNRKDKHDRTPLLFACLTGMYDVFQNSNHQATAELLVQEQVKCHASFAQINVPTKRGRTPLREAAARGFVKVIAAIIGQMKSDDKEKWIDHRDNQKGRTALHSAAVHGRAEATALLLQNGADPSLRDGDEGKGMTSLELCLDRWAVVGSQQYERYETAIAHLVDANVKEATENTSLLTTAAIHGSVLILEKLANAGVNLNLPDAYGWTPSQLTAQYGHTQAELCIRQSLAKKALRPTQWVSHKEVKSTTILQEDGKHVSHLGENRVSISADHPVPAGLSTYYYEVEFLDPETGEPHDAPTDGNSKQPIIAVGFSTSSTVQLIQFPGWDPLATAPNIETWAYHGDDGFFGASDPKKWRPAFGQHFGAGDTIGAGLEMDAKQIFFTRNGVRIDDHTFNGFKGRVFPVLGLEDKVQLRTNFGTDPARPFKWVPLQDEQVATKKESLNGKPVSTS